MEKKILLAEALPGMILSAPIVNENGRIILGEGTVLSEVQLVRLSSIGIISLQIKLELAEEIAIKTPLQTTYRDTISQVKKAFHRIRYFQEVPILQMKELVFTSLEPLLETNGLVSYLQTIKETDDYTFQHSIRVAIISGILAKWLGFSGTVIQDIILAGLLHDIGKNLTPLEILNKPERLTSEEMTIIKDHPIAGYRLLTSTLTVSQSVLLGILQHHERNDGSGYPMGCKGEKIHQYGKIIAVADIYDAMTAERVHQKRQTPFDVVEVLCREMYDKLDPTICTIFLNNVRSYFVGNIVILDDGRKAKVISLNIHAAARPIVQTEDGMFIDLELKKEIAIVDYIAS